MAAPKKEVKRIKHIDTRLTLSEFEKIKSKAKYSGITSSEYLRNIALNYPIKSVVDQIALDELIKAKSDLGRVGGLFKKWLSNDENTKVKLGSKSYNEIVLIVEQLDLKEKVLLDCAKKMLDKI